MYVLTYPNGARVAFLVRACAEIFQQCYGGELVYKQHADLE